MNERQIPLPPSFIALHVPPGRQRPVESREQLEARHELCEDLAQMLTESTAARRAELGVTEFDVLERVHRGLCAEGSPVSAVEAGWVVCRLAELLGWELPVERLQPAAE